MDEKLKETKSEIRSRIYELLSLKKHISSDVFSARIEELLTERDNASEDIFTAILESHKAVCEAKGMGFDEAYGQEPSAYYTLGICAEAGELANKIVRNLRNGYNKEKIIESIKGELPDVVIYSFILAHVLGINLNELVSEKTQVVIERAKNGYYGGSVNRKRIFELKSYYRGISFPSDLRKCEVFTENGENKLGDAEILKDSNNETILMVCDFQIENNRIFLIKDKEMIFDAEVTNRFC